MVIILLCKDNFYSVISSIIRLNMMAQYQKGQPLWLPFIYRFEILFLFLKKILTCVEQVLCFFLGVVYRICVATA